MEQILQTCYEVFGVYKSPKTLDACTDCCISKDQEAQLLNQSVRYLSFETLYAYNTAAKTAQPSLEEFKYFLPRFLELSAEWNYLHHSIDLIFKRFEYYTEDDWTQDEKACLQGFAEAWFQEGLSTYPLPDYEQLFELLLTLSYLPVSTEAMLSQWAQHDELSSLMHLHDVCNYHFSFGKLDLKDIASDRPIRTLFSRWFTAPETRQIFLSRIEHQLMDSCLADQDAASISSLYELLT